MSRYVYTIPVKKSGYVRHCDGLSYFVGEGEGGGLLWAVGHYIRMGGADL